MENLKFEVIDGKLEIPEGVTSIEYDAIDSPYSVKELIIPESVQKIAIDAFNGCSSLKKVTLPIRFIKPIEDDNLRWKFHSDGLDTSSWFSVLFQKRGLDISEITFIGDEDSIAIRSGFKSKRLNATIIKFDGRINRLKIGERLDNNKFYINNYIENVEVEGTDKWTDKDLFFRAPKANGKVDGKLVELTLCPRKSFYDDKRWSCPITLHSDAVTYIYGIELDCYEEQVAPNVSKNKHIGSRIALVGRAPHELTQEEQIEYTERFPYVVVWESPEFVVSKLKQAGWHI